MVEDVLANDLILSEDKQHMIDNVVEWVQHNIANDRKVGALKQLQGHIWRSGFRSGQLVAPLFRDVPDALAEWRNLGIKTYIYSSGSREAQRLLFSHTQVIELQLSSVGSGVDHMSCSHVLLLACQNNNKGRFVASYIPVSVVMHLAMRA